jgi:predicted  nucleic acid-binding Zn-ribbon protein
MDSNQLRELATNAQLDHWPPHLGVRTDAEKIEYLVKALRSVDDYEAQIEEIAAERDSLADQVTQLENKLYDQEDRVDKFDELRGKVSEAEGVLADIKIGLEELEAKRK